jgi:chromosome segregation ATPase
MRRNRKINELRATLNKHQSENKEYYREIIELKIKIRTIKEEVTQDMENLRKKNQTETQNTVEGHSKRLEQVEDRISELEDKIEIKEKTEEMLVKQLKSCGRDMRNSPISSKDQT